jgi:hypothetical protein
VIGMLRRKRRTEKVLVSNNISAPFSALSEPPAGDYRGIPSDTCPCGCDFLILCVRFDPDERLPGFYLLDARCASCGSWLTAPTPVDGEHE